MSGEEDRAVIRIFRDGEIDMDSPDFREQLTDDRQRAQWDAGWRPRAWNAWQGWTQWFPGPETGLQEPETEGPTCGGGVWLSDGALSRFENVPWANAFHEVRDVD